METIPFCNILGLQDVMQCEHADIQRRQEHQLDITKQVQEVNQRGQDAIKHGQEVIQCRQQQHVEVTEHVLAVVQGLERGQEYISRQLEPRGTVKGGCGTHVCIVVD